MRNLFRQRSVSTGALLLAALFPGSPASAQNSPKGQALASVQPRPAPPGLLAAVDVMAGTVQDIVLERESNGDWFVQAVLGNRVRHLVLSPFEVRAAGFKLLVNDGVTVTEVAAPPCVTYRGFVVEDPAVVVSATIENGSLTAQVLEAQQTWVIQPVRDVVPTAGPRAHLVYRQADNANLPHTCGTQGLGVAVTSPPIGTDVIFTAEIACEADPQFYGRNGSSVTATQNDITSIINGVDVIYQRDVEVAFQITQIVVTTGSSPYTTNDPGNLLNEFQNNWNQSYTSVQRDTAHLFTGRNLAGSVIGIASLGTVCSQSNAYGLSQSRFTTNFNRRVGLTAHELGHSFSAAHCNSSSPCFIMCSGLGGCDNSVTQFGQSAAGQVSTFRRNAPCLSFVQVTPVINSITPSQTSVFWPTAIDLFGTGFLGTTTIRVGSNIVPVGQYAIVNDTQIRFTPPQGAALGTENVTVTNAAGTSNTVTMSYGETTPCKLIATGGLNAGQTVNFSFGGKLDHTWFLLAGFGNATSLLQGFDVLISPIVLAAGRLDATRGLGSFAIPTPPGLGVSLIINTQLLEADPVTGALTSSSNIPFTVILP